MSTDRIVNVTSAEHLAELLEGDLPVLVDFTAEWCAPCKQAEPDLHAFAEDNAERLIVAAVDIDEHPAIYRGWGINGVPNYRLVHGGAIQVASGGGYRETLDDWYGTYLDQHPTAPEGGQPLPAEGEARTTRVVPDGEADVLELTDALLAELVEGGPWQNLVTARRFMSDDDVVRLVQATQPHSFTMMGFGRDPDAAEFLATLQAASPMSMVGRSWCSPTVAASRVKAGLEVTPAIPSDNEMRNLAAAMKLIRRGGKLHSSIALMIPDGWYAFPPESTEGLAVAATSTTDGVTISIGEVETDDAGHLAGTASLPLVIEGDTDRLTLDLRVQLCAGDVCNAPVTIAMNSGPIMDYDAMTAAAAV